MLDLTLWLATPIAQVVMDKFFGSAASKLGEQTIDGLPQKVKDGVQRLGQLLWQLTSQVYLMTPSGQNRPRTDDGRLPSVVGARAPSGGSEEPASAGGGAIRETRGELEDEFSPAVVR